MKQFFEFLSMLYYFITTLLFMLLKSIGALAIIALPFVLIYYLIDSPKDTLVFIGIILGLIVAGSIIYYTVSVIAKGAEWVLGTFKPKTKKDKANDMIDW